MRDEKFDEKESEKREEKSPEEKSWDEKWRRDPLGSIVWAAIFIWAGVVLLATNLGLFNAPGLGFLARIESWSIILIGAGLIVLLEVLVRLLVPAYRRPVGGSIFLALALIGFGLGDIFGVEIVWPLILIALGLSVLLRGLARGR